MYIRIQQVTSPEDREAVFRFRYRIYVEELGKPLPVADHKRRIYQDELDDAARILVALDESTGAIVGTLRSNFGSEQPFNEELIGRFNLAPMMVAFGHEQIAHSSAFMVDPAYRGQTVASQLVGRMYAWALAEGIMIDTCVSEFALARAYFQLGYRPYGPLFRAHAGAGLRVPLAMVTRDRHYLARVGSPLARFHGEGDPDRGDIAQRLRDLYPLFEDQGVTPQKLREFWASVAHANTRARPPSIFDGVDRDRVDPLLSSLPTVKVTADEAFYRRGENEQGMGLLLRGRLGVTIEEGERPFFLTILQPGDVFGEMSNFVTSGRTATLLALEETEVLLLPHNLIQKLEQLDAEIARKVKDNLTNILAQRLDAMNRQVAGFMRGSPQRVSLGPEFEVAGQRRESYSFTTLGDTRGELERLERQGIIGEDLEVGWFRRVGIGDGQTLLDLGAGPGVTCLLLARSFPTARIVGLEPDPALRSRAEQRAADAGCEDRCTFIDGIGERIPLQADTVDASYARFLFQHLPEPLKVVQEMARVTRPGGRVVLVDGDDGGLVLHPEPDGFSEFRQRVARAQQAQGGDRLVGRKLFQLLQQAGLQDIQVEVVPITPALAPMERLLDIMFSFKTQTMQRGGALTPADQQVLEQLEALPQLPGAWLLVPVIVAWASVPRPALSLPVWT